MPEKVEWAPPTRLVGHGLKLLTHCCHYENILKKTGIINQNKLLPDHQTQPEIDGKSGPKLTTTPPSVCSFLQMWYLNFPFAPQLGPRSQVDLF